MLAHPEYHFSRKNLWILISAFFLIGLIRILNHSMWGDELQVWVIAHKSLSLFQLFHNIRYEGHPCLWFLCVWILSSIWNNPVIMQLFHILIATFSIWVVFRYAPFSRWIKILFATGYYPFCEYAIISRGYSLVVALAFAFTAVFCFPKRRVLLMAILLFVMTQVDVFGTILAISFSFIWLLDEFMRRGKKVSSFVHTPFNSLGFAVVLVILGIILAVVEMKPPADSPFSLINFSLNLKRFTIESQGIFQAFFPLRPWSDIGQQPSGYMILPAVFLALVAFLCAVRNRLSLVLLSVGFIGIWSFVWINGYFIGMSPRWSGFILVIFLCSQWVAQADGFGYINEIVLPQTLHNTGQILWKPFMIFTLLVSLAGSVDFNIGELSMPFSTGREVANYIKENNFQDLPIVGSIAPFMTTISAYLDRPIIEAANGRSSYFYVRDRFVDMPLSGSQWGEVVHRLGREKGDVLIITTYPIQDAPRDFRFLRNFSQGKREGYGIYICQSSSSTANAKFIPTNQFSGLPPSGH